MITDEIKRLITVKNALSLYVPGYNGKERIPCPIHHGKDLNFAVYADGFQCFSCNKSGSVIDLVMQIFGINIQQAIVRIDSDFHLGLVNRPFDRQEYLRQQAEREAKQKEIENYRAEYDHNILEYRRLWEAKHNKMPKCPTDTLDPEFVESLHRLPELDYWFETHEWK